MDNQLINTVRNKKKLVIIAVHVLAWLAVFLLPYLLNPEYNTEPVREIRPRPDFRDLNTVTKILWVIAFYLNAIVLVPRLVYKSKFVAYFFALLGLFAATMLVHGILFQVMMEGYRFRLLRSVFFNSIPFALTIILSTAYKAISDQIRSQQLLAEQQTENLKTELSFLRSQISPHFLFNVMNNIVALVRLKSDELEPTVMKLSSLMQYMLYETDEEKVLLKSEAEYLQSYIDLQRQRFGSKLAINVTFDLKEDWHTIEPMLLIPFVENAFKHGNGMLQQPQIDIRLSVANNQLYFLVRNNFEERTRTKDKTSGIGLANVTRRLELLYPGKHQLIIDKKDNWFTVDLHLTLR